MLYLGACTGSAPPVCVPCCLSCDDFATSIQSGATWTEIYSDSQAVGSGSMSGEFSADCDYYFTTVSSYAATIDLSAFSSVQDVCQAAIMFVPNCENTFDISALSVAMNGTDMEVTTSGDLFLPGYGEPGGTIALFLLGVLSGVLVSIRIRLDMLDASGYSVTVHAYACNGPV